MLLQQLVIYALLGVILDQLGADWTNSLYWCVLVLVGTSNYLARREGFTDGLEAADSTLKFANDILDKARSLVEKHDAEHNKENNGA